MIEDGRAVRRRQFCGRCGQLMFEFYLSPDGHYGMVSDVRAQGTARRFEIRCATCGARYRLLERADVTGQLVARV